MSWQPLGPLLKVKLLVGYMRSCLCRVGTVNSRRHVKSHDQLEGAKGIRLSPKMCQVVSGDSFEKQARKHPHFFMADSQPVAPGEEGQIVELAVTLSFLGSIEPTQEVDAESLFKQKENQDFPLKS